MAGSKLEGLGEGSRGKGLEKQGTHTCVLAEGPLGSPLAQRKCNLPSSSSVVIIYLSGRYFGGRNPGLHTADSNEGNRDQKRDKAVPLGLPWEAKSLCVSGVPRLL